MKGRWITNIPLSLEGTLCFNLHILRSIRAKMMVQSLCIPALMILRYRHIMTHCTAIKSEVMSSDYITFVAFSTKDCTKLMGLARICAIHMKDDNNEIT